MFEKEVTGIVLIIEEEHSVHQAQLVRRQLWSESSIKGAGSVESSTVNSVKKTSLSCKYSHEDSNQLPPGSPGLCHANGPVLSSVNGRC